MASGRWLRAVLLALLVVGCGARTALDTSDRMARDAGARDAGARDAGGPCATLRAIGEPIAVFDERRAEGPLVVARHGGFDVTSMVIRADTPPAYHARRVEVRDGRVELGPEARLGPEATSVGALGVRGDRLAFCYGDRDLEGPTLFVHTDVRDYARVTRARIGDEGGDHCVALVAGADRWLVGWQDRGGGSLGWAVAEIDDDGALLGPRVPLAVPPLAAAAVDGALAYAHHDPLMRNVTHVVFREPGGMEREVLLVSDATGAAEELAMIASPFASALEVAWTDRARTLTVARVAPEGTIDDLVASGPLPEILSRPALAALDGGVLFAVAACDLPIEGPGAITLTRRERSVHSMLLSLGRPVCPVRPALATLEDRALLAWQENERVFVQALECAR